MDGIVILSRIAGGAIIDVVAVWMIIRSLRFDDGRLTDAVCIIALLGGLGSLFMYPPLVSMMLLFMGGMVISGIGANGVWPPHPTKWDRQHRGDSIIVLAIGVTMLITSFAILGYMAYTEPPKVVPTCLC